MRTSNINRGYDDPTKENVFHANKLAFKIWNEFLALFQIDLFHCRETLNALFHMHCMLMGRSIFVNEGIEANKTVARW